jgi:transposase-like protein
MDAILSQPQFRDEAKAREWLEAIRWPDGPICPHCASVSKDHYALNGSAHRPGVYKCKDCREQFTVTVGTVFERSKIKLNVWLQAMHLMCSSKKGISSKQLERMLGVTYQTAWFMSHRIREAMKPTGGGLLGSGGKAVEADETFVGRKPGSIKRRGYAHKEAVFSLVERKGTVRSFHVPDVTGATLKAKLQANVATKARLMTDDAGQYRHSKEYFPKHQVVAHSRGEYVRGKVHTNTIEGFFSIFKRGIYGVYQHVSSTHLERYTTEFDFRYNHREKRVKIAGKWQMVGYNDAERTTALLKGIGGKRLLYRPIGEAQAF